MNTRLKSILVLVLMTLVLTVKGQQEHLTIAQIQQLAKNLKPQRGEIKIQDGLATLNVPTNFYYLNANDTKTVLVDLWGNPPTQVEGTLGMLIPSDLSPLDPDCWAVTISYSDSGYVKDGDAGKINYDDLLKQMQKAVQENNKAREQKGYADIQLVGWAAPPRYDAATHKLYWAKELNFQGESENTLNYDIRILGRHGVLELDAVAPMHELSDIEKQTPNVLGMVNFDQGNRYADFDPKVDKVAAFGIAALIAGGVAAKLGLFKLILVFLVAAKKFIILAAAAVAAWFRKIFKRRKDVDPTV
jgi:uncharacterized membrane-anchored protein